MPTSITIIAPLLIAFAWTTDTHADGAVNIDACQALSSPNTTYRLTANLTSNVDRLIVAADGITIDLRGHSVAGPAVSVLASPITASPTTSSSSRAAPFLNSRTESTWPAPA